MSKQNITQLLGTEISIKYMKVMSKISNYWDIYQPLFKEGKSVLRSTPGPDPPLHPVDTRGAFLGIVCVVSWITL